ncbi:MAG TPA: glycosyltransferase [Solirubrobacteraceae bacterium]|nr:glycosyltransferase [Solirubrobacteraceae bacterium]
MIVVTIGTNEQPFDRLIRAARALDSDELLVQYGSSREPHGRGEWVEFLSFDELASRAREASAVVCHAGVGSIMLARRCGHRPIVMPRRHHLGEAVDDHQLFLAKRLAKSGIVTLVEDEQELAAALAAPLRAAEARADTISGAGALTADLRALLGDLGAARAA